ncbi:MAG: hypothetical protein V4760_08705 [Bdellovibrionota bacterium]
MAKISRFLFILMVSSLVSLEASAALSPLSVGLFPPVQFPPSDFSVTGFRASLLWGRHRDVYGLDLGVLGNITDQSFTGIAVSGLFNATHGTTNIIGLQAAGLANFNTNKTRVFGVQLAALLNKNDAESSLSGVQFALVNLSPNMSIYGLQAGIYNKARSVYGFQIGLVNSCTDLHGLQIGLVNFHEKGLFAVSPIINFGF